MKVPLLLLLLLLSFSIYAQIPEEPSQGNGTIDNPYQIASFPNLYWLAQVPGVWGMHFIQTADIDASDSALISSPEPNTAGWIPIGQSSPFFTGSYDGQGYKIMNLQMHRPTMQYAGLFGYLNGARLNRIHLRNATILGQQYTGGLAGVANSGTVINNCSVTGSVTGVTNVGGILGYCDGSGTTNCYTQATVSASSDQVGGFVGLSGWNNGTYHQFCYSTGSVNAPNANYKGGFIGRTGSVSIRDCYWDLQSSGMATDPLATGKSTAQMKQRATYTRWNFHNQWSIEENISYPNLDGLLYYTTPLALTTDDLWGSGTASEPYVLMSAADLNVMRQDLDASYLLGADIDLSSCVVWNMGQGWQAVGSSGNPFTGTFDGNGHTINGLSISKPKADQQGLFGYTNGATIRRLNLTNCHILGQSNVAGVVGFSKSSNLDEISFDGIILAHTASGGIAGVLENGYLQRSWAEVDMKNYSDYAGGLIGYITSSGSISGTLSNSGSTGSVEGHYNTGGLVGMVVWGYLLNSYNHASVYAADQAGGLVGTVGWSNPGYVSRCFSTGQVTVGAGGYSSGGLVARHMNGSVLESYWDTQSSGMSTSSGTGATGKTTAEMMQQSTFLRWNFDTLWQMGSRGYPSHKDLSVYALPLALSTSDLWGSGTQNEPYVILTIDELNVMPQAPGAYYLLNNDIDLSATCVWNGGKGWAPVGDSSVPFTGSFEGANHTLSHLFIERPDENYVGLFGYISNSFINDIEFQDANLHANDQIGVVTGYAVDSRIDKIGMQGTLSGRYYLGGIAGNIHRSIIQRSWAELKLWATSHNAGGIAGYVSSDANFNSTISICKTAGSIRAQENAGGLVGYLYRGALINSTSYASVQGYSNNGGAVGTCGWDYTSTLVRSYSTGLIVSEPGGYSNNGLVGRFQNGLVYDCYWDTESSGTSSGGATNAIGLSTSAMRQQASYQNWNFSTLWQISEGTGYPGFLDISIYEDPLPVVLTELWGTGTPEDPYLIMTASELNAIRQNPEAHYRIHNDLDLAATLVWNGGRGWQPVGSPDEPFTGTLDGNGMTIENLNIAAPLTNNVGFFGKITNGIIINLNLTALNLVAEDNAGAVAGAGASCNLNSVKVQAKLSGRNAVGGLIGVASGATVQNCSSSVNILARNNYIGGLLGTANTNTLVSESSSTGFVKGYSLVGGLLGELYNGNVSDCYSHADVTASTDLGGAVGRIGWGESGHLARCYSTGAIIVNPGGYSAGGLVGSLYNGTISASFWDVNASGMSSSSGTGATGLSTVQMTHPGSLNYYDAWDFVNVWHHDTGTQNGGYPLLIWQERPVPEAVQNLSINRSGEQLLLQWQAVVDADSYRIYASDDPYAPWSEWSYLGQSSNNEFLVNGVERQFFMVRAVAE